VIIDLTTGKVFLRHWNSNPSPLTQPDHTVSIGTVSKEDLPLVLQEQARVCCGVKRQKYVLATANDVSVWYTGHLNELPPTAKEIIA